MVTIFNPESKNESIKLANILRDQNINTFLYPDANIKLDKQLKSADRKQIPFVLILGPEEIETNTVTVKNMQEKKQDRVNQSDILQYLK